MSLFFAKNVVSSSVAWTAGAARRRAAKAARRIRFMGGAVRGVPFGGAYYGKFPRESVGVFRPGQCDFAAKFRGWDGATC